MGRVRAVIVVLALTLAHGTAAPALPAGSWRPAPEYLPLVAPAGARGAFYAAFVSPQPLAEVLRQLEREPLVLRPPGAWLPQPQPPGDAFGQTGRYDRWKLPRLYGSRRAVVARGPATSATGAPEAWTLISPHPDPALQRLEPGTLLIVLSLDRP